MKLKTPITLVVAVLFTFSTITAQTRDGWRSVRTNHLFVIGNADPENLRRVAVWLEYFHAAFARLVSRNVIDSSVPTTVIVFRDDASFTPFKPVYNGRPTSISGFFLPGDDVNYIALSLDPRGDPYGTAFHEYVHLHVKDNIPNAPVWLNEGLAELYEALQFSGSDVIIGMPDHNYLYTLRQAEMLPLKTLFAVGLDSPHYNERDKAGLFYGESWALVHYLMFGDRARQDQFKRFLQRIGSGDDAAKAIEATYGTTLDVIEQELQSYVRRANLTAQRITGVANPEAYRSYTATQRSALTDSEAYYYLSDLLLHMGRHAAAEKGLKEAIAQDPGFLPAYAALGSMYVEQRRYAEAKKYLQKATTSPQTYLVHYYYAYVLSREGVSANGEVSQYSRENAAVMREQLLQSIKLAPNYAPAYYLLGVVNYFSDRIDEALEMAQKAQQLSPGNKNYAELVDDIKQYRAGSTTARERREPIKGDAIAEPTRTTSSRMLGGGSGPVAINDGRTVDNSGALPTVDDVLNKYVQAIGGAAAVNAVNSRVVKGTLDIVGVSRGGKFESYSVAPNKSLSIIQPAPTETIKTGYNGSIGWMQTPTGVRLLKGAELVATRNDADFYGIINPKNNYAKLTLVGKSKIGYREVYVIDLQPLSGAVDRLFIDAESYLPVRMNTVRTHKGASVPVEIYYDDWREADGLKLPHVLTHSFQKQTMTLTVKEIKTNVPVDAKIFEKP
ncbi:MAG TPA: tetratricopeptide repeat protein [Pyrinomonadaceae bacterium]|nr:tetratricopeptide repeat protein [Pyrinomonadaceae bacterium]